MTVKKKKTIIYNEEDTDVSHDTDFEKQKF